MKWQGLLWAGAASVVTACASAPAASDRAEARRQVMETERAFAQTMADRDHAAFQRFLAEDAIFLAEPDTLHGRAAVAAGWKRYYERPTAPFSWEPARVEVLPDGGLALSTGPVRDPTGKLIGTFTSVWRQEAPGVWRIVFDKGDSACDCKKP